VLPAVAAPSTTSSKPKMRFIPPISTRSTSFSSPGSNRMELPAGTSNRMPNASVRSKSRARFTSKKW